MSTTKEKAQPTPGPWEMSKDATPDWHTQITVYSEATGERVATVFQSEANAVLVHAAPEMAEALASIMAAIVSLHSSDHDYLAECDCEDAKAWRKAEAALRKAGRL